MRRFWSDMDTLAGLSRVNRRRLALGVVLGYLMISQYWNLQYANSEGASAGPLKGPMAAYRVDESSAPSPCRSAGCTVDGGPAGQVRRRLVLPLVLELPALVDVPAPEGAVMVPATAGPWSTVDDHLGPGHRLPMMLRPRAQAASPSRDEQQRLRVPSAGVVAEARVAGTGQRVLATGQVVDAQGRPVDGEPQQIFDLLRLQPLPAQARAHGTGPWAQAPVKERDYLLLFRWPATGTVEAEGPALWNDGLRAKVLDVDASDPAQPRVTLSIGWSGPFAGDLARLAQGQRASGSALVPDRVGLVDLTGSGDALQLVPTAAVQHDDRGDRVWAVIEGYAVPVAVRVQGRDVDRAWVVELPQERNRPVRATDWQALGGHARAAVYRLHKPGAGVPLLASQGVRVISRPSATLKPGMPVALKGEPRG